MLVGFIILDRHGCGGQLRTLKMRCTLFFFSLLWVFYYCYYLLLSKDLSSQNPFARGDFGVTGHCCTVNCSTRVAGYA